MVAYAVLGMVIALAVVILCIGTLVVSAIVMRRLGFGMDPHQSGSEGSEGEKGRGDGN